MLVYVTEDKDLPYEYHKILAIIINKNTILYNGSLYILFVIV